MYCKECGKALDPGAKFCSNCGVKVEKEPEPFVPAFMKSYGTEPEKETPAPKRKTYEREVFDWNLDGFPDPNKKTEEVDFNWSSVLEDNQRKIYGLEKGERERKPLIDSTEMSFDKDTVAAYEAKTREREIEQSKKAAEEEKARLQAEAKSEGDRTKTETQEEAEREFEELLKTVPELNESEYEIPDSLFKEPDEGKSEPEEKEESKPYQSLEDELFADMGSLAGTEEPPAATIVAGRNRTDSSNVDKFYTFNQKKTELQALLDREYARLEKLNRTEEEELLKLEDILEESKTEETGPIQTEEETPEEAAEEIPEPEIRTAPAPVYVGVQLAAAPAGVYVEPEISDVEVDEEDSCVQEPAETVEPVEIAEPVETAEEEPAAVKEAEDSLPSKGEEAEERKLTFGDVFNDDDDDYDEDTKKGGCLKVIAILLCIIVVIQLALIGIQYFAPDSEPAKVINKGYSKIIGMISGKEEPATPTDEASELSNIIKAHASENRNIASVREDAGLAFEAGKDYGFEGFDETYRYENAPWYTDKDDEEITYLDGIVSTLIGYYSAWVDKMDDDSDEIYSYVGSRSPAKESLDELSREEGVVYSIESLDIGEIRFDGSGFYVLTKVVYVNSEESEKTEELQVVNLEPNNEMMEIMNIVII